MRVRKLTPKQFKSLVNRTRNQFRCNLRYFGPTGTGDWRLRHIPLTDERSRKMLIIDAIRTEKKHRKFGHDMHQKPWKYRNDIFIAYPPDCLDGNCKRCYPCFRNYVMQKVAGDLD